MIKLLISLFHVSVRGLLWARILLGQFSKNPHCLTCPLRGAPSTDPLTPLLHCKIPASSLHSKSSFISLPCCNSFKQSLSYCCDKCQINCFFKSRQALLKHQTQQIDFLGRSRKYIFSVHHRRDHLTNSRNCVSLIIREDWFFFLILLQAVYTVMVKYISIGDKFFV